MDHGAAADAQTFGRLLNGMDMRLLELGTGVPGYLVGIAQIGHAVGGKGQSFAGLEALAMEDTGDLFIGKFVAKLRSQGTAGSLLSLVASAVTNSRLGSAWRSKRRLKR